MSITKYVFLKLPLMSDHTSSFEALVKRMADKWSDIHTRSITRKKKQLKIVDEMND